MATIFSENTHIVDRERSMSDQPQVVRDAIAEREAAIAAGKAVLKFDENGMAVISDGS